MSDCCHGHDSKSSGDPGPATSSPVRDPVCGMTVDPQNAKGHWDHAGATYYFCSPKCLQKFQLDPERYLRPPAPANIVQIGVPVAAPPAAAATSQSDPKMPEELPLYTCPMHPEIRNRGPGTCPKCGMALEPLEITAEEAPNPELALMARRFWVSLVLSLPILLLDMGEMLPGDLLSFLPRGAGVWIQGLLATPVVLWGGWPFFVRAWESLGARSPNMFTLIGIGTGVAYGYSVVALLFPDRFPESFRGHGGQIGVYFESAAVIVTLVLLGQVLELAARARTGQAIKALLRLAPKEARVVRPDGREVDVPIELVEVGMLLRVLPGQAVPVDGVVVEGTSALDESMVSGEPIPVDKGPGDKVVGGTVNGMGGIIMRAERVGRDTLLSQIVRMVGEAQRSRAQIQGVADRVAAWFVPIVVLVAIVTFFAWAWFGTEAPLAHALVNAVAVLIIACPCALGLATPMSIMVAVGRGATEGVLIKNAEAIERIETIDTLVVDKTGTLTEGRPALVHVEALDSLGENELLTLAASLEQASEHPLARAVVERANGLGLALARPEEVKATAGAGIEGTVGGRRVAVGSARLIADAARLEERANGARAQGQTVLFAAVDGRAAGMLVVADRVKESTPEALAQLRADGIEVVMLTGDGRPTALAVAKSLGIDQVEAEVSPLDKEKVVARLQGTGRSVAMAGDGVNDAPALARADVGIAMGTGTDVAIASAGVALVKGDLRGIVRARHLGRATMRNIRQNLFFAFLYNTLGIPIAAGALYPWFGILLSPMLASAAMSASSVSVIANALRLRRIRL